MYAFMMDIVLHRARHKMTYPVKKTVPGNWTDRQTDEWTDGRTIVPSYGSNTITYHDYNDNSTERTNCM